VSEFHKISGCDNAARQADVIFLHGLGGDAYDTWNHGRDESTLWPKWLGDHFPNVGVWSVGYAASPLQSNRPAGYFLKKLEGLLPVKNLAGHTLPLPDRASQLLNRMQQLGIGRRPLVFIVHSLGGLVAKQILHNSANSKQPGIEDVFKNTRAVLFLATPHTGADLPKLLNPLRDIFGTSVTMEELRAHDAHLRNLHDWYRNHAQSPQIQTTSYFETRGVGNLLPIVNPTSAHPGIGRDPIPAEDDHLSIAKPRKPDDPVCLTAIQLVEQALRNHQPAPPLPSPSPQHGDPPYQLPPAPEHFVGRIPELQRLTERLRAGLNTAVVGPGGLGKTALASQALANVVSSPAVLPYSPYPDGILFLDLYSLHGNAEQTWHTLANILAGPGFLDRSTGRERATEACRHRRCLIVLEGGEEAHGTDGRPDIRELLSVLSPPNRWLLLTRLSHQATPQESVELRHALDPSEAARLFHSLTRETIAPALADQVLELLEGHPLALTWAAGLLARNDEDPAYLVKDWRAGNLPSLYDPVDPERTLRWLFDRSIRGLNETARLVLDAAGLLARTPFPLDAIVAALPESLDHKEKTAREALRTLVQHSFLDRSSQQDHWQFVHVLAYRFARKDIGASQDLLLRLAHWLIQSINDTLAAGEPLALANPLRHAAALLRADESQYLWLVLADPLLYEISDRLEDLGRLPISALALDAVESWFAALPAETAKQPRWSRERTTLLNKRGNVLQEQGDLANALLSFRASLHISQSLAVADPSNSTWQRDLSISHNNVGNVLQEQGDLANALLSFRDSLHIRQSLAQDDPSNSNWQRDLSISHNNVGNVLRVQGDLANALLSFRASLHISQSLAVADPSNSTWQRDLSISHNNVGNVLQEQGDLANALLSFRASLRIRQSLAQSDPSNSTWQRDLSISHNNVGNVLQEQGDLANALLSIRASLRISQSLAQSDPSNSTWQRDLSISHNKLAQLYEMQGSYPEALQHAEKSLAIIERLSAHDHTNAIWRNDARFTRALVQRLKNPPPQHP